MANPQWKKGMPQVPKTAATNTGHAVAYRKTTLRGLDEVVLRIAKQYNKIVDPAEILLMVAAGIDPLQQVNKATGQMEHPEVLDLEIRVDAAKAVINYYRPKLSQVELSGNDEKPIAIDARMSARLSTDADFRKMAENIIIRQVELLKDPAMIEGEVEEDDDRIIDVDVVEADESLIKL